MPNITFPNTFAAATVTNATSVAQNLFDPNSTPDSCDVMNGYLTRENLATVGGEQIQFNHVQRGAMMTGGSVGGTTNLDYFSDWFEETPTVASGSASDSSWVPVPAAGVSHYVPTGATALIYTWNVSYQYASSGPTDSALLSLFINGVRDTTQVRYARSTVVDSATWDTNLRPYFWSGHHYVSNPAEGWHNAGLRIFMDDGAQKQARVYVRGFRYVILK